MSKPYLSPEEASLQLGICPREIRKNMRLGKLDLGLAIPPGDGKRQWTFRIYQGKIDKITGNSPNDQTMKAEMTDADNLRGTGAAV